ncbi:MULTISPECIES: YbfB/YjiJ family MFS transporter [unclassified Bartonella]
MGIGKFLYTPILPVILDKGLFTFNQLSYIASANYGGGVCSLRLAKLGIYLLLLTCYLVQL